MCDQSRPAAAASSDITSAVAVPNSTKITRPTVRAVIRVRITVPHGAQSCLSVSPSFPSLYCRRCRRRALPTYGTPLTFLSADCRLLTDPTGHIKLKSPCVCVQVCAAARAFQQQSSVKLSLQAAVAVALAVSSIHRAKVEPRISRASSSSNSSNGFLCTRAHVRRVLCAVRRRRRCRCATRGSCSHTHTLTHKQHIF